jgi:periplasmic divalent cation tolerance protein
MTANTPLQVNISFPDQTTAETVARQLVEQKLVACAQLFPIQSIYRWEGIQSDAEILLQAKTVAEQLVAIESLVLAAHPYELPEIIAIPIVWGYEPYLEWLRQESGSTTQD